MPKEAKPFLVLWLGGLLITDALIAAAFAAYFLLAHGEMVCQMEHVSSDSDARKPCTNGAVAESADCGIAIVPIVAGLVMVVEWLLGHLPLSLFQLNCLGC